jgi:hypothetical protein
MTRSFRALVALLAFASCASPDSVRVTLDSRATGTRDPRQLDIRAQVAGPTDGLEYHWFAVAGENEPQVSQSPWTVFRFAEGSVKDRVTLEVWRDGARVAQREIDVQPDADLVETAAQRAPRIGVEITRIPPYEPDGGDATRADIGGRVTGEVAPDHQVVIYARADAWYIQPHSHTSHPIGADGSWSTWTHTGSSYAALVVRPGFDAYTRLDVLPQVGNYVVARTIVEGVRR